MDNGACSYRRYLEGDEAFFEENVLLVSYYATSEDSGHIVGPSYYTATEDRLLLTMDYAQYPVSQSSYQGMEQHFMCQTPLSRDAYQGQEIEQIFRCRLDECCILFHTDG